MSIVIAVIIFSLLIFIHELGHFLLAKKNGIRVVEFSIGMGPRLFSFEKGHPLFTQIIILWRFLPDAVGRLFEDEELERIKNTHLKINPYGQGLLSSWLARCLIFFWHGCWR